MKKLFKVSWAAGLLLALCSFAVADDNKHDGEIQDHLNKDLKSDKFNNVQARVQDGLVYLSGTVDKYSDREKAEHKVASIHNVKGVRDEIEVAGKRVGDDQLRKELADKLRYGRLSNGMQVFDSLNLGVQDGYVTLSGQVRDESDRDYAESVAARTPGVRGVHNEIQVEQNGAMDEELRYRVARAIYGYPTLQMYATDPQAPIRIVVENGNVTLYGYVSSDVDKNVAAMQARQVFGVKNVDNKLMTPSDMKKSDRERSDRDHR